MNIKKVFLIFLLASTIFLGFITQTEGFKEAFFKNVQFNPKVYDGEPILIDVTVRNQGVTSTFEDPKFFLTVFADNILVYDEASQPWSCPLNSETSRKIVVSNLKGPKEYLMRIELYWLNETIAIQEDVYQFKLIIVKLFIKDFDFSIVEAQAGAEKPSELKINFKNGGNDEMLNISMKVVESSGLIVTPNFKSLGSLKPEETLETFLFVSAPLEAALGIHQLTFQILYFDFRGISHIENFNIQVKVVKLKVKIDIYAPSTIKYKESTILTIKLKDVNEKPIVEAPVKFYLNSSFIGMNLTSNIGEATLIFNANFKAGKYKVEVEYPGSNIFEASNSSITLTIEKASTKIVIEAPETGKVNEESLIKVKLIDEYNESIGGATIKLHADSQILTGLTNSLGEAKFTYKPLNKGRIQIKALYEGNENYSSCYALTIITVEPIKTSLTLITQPFIQGNEIQVKAILKDEFNNPISNASLTFTFIVNDNPIYKETVLTNNFGEAFSKCKFSSVNSIKIKVEFLGSEKFSGSSASTLIYPSTAILFIIGLILTATVATIIFVYAKKFHLLNKIGSLIRIGFPKLLKPEQPKNKCIQCGLEIPKGALYCSKCGAYQFPYAASTSLLTEEDKKVLDYIVSHGGTISIPK
ncbi:MAG: hypothetical protein QXE30_04525, partial [Candidatus Bathyarchaeia archaeon]